MKLVSPRPFSSFNSHVALNFIYGFRLWEGLGNYASKEKEKLNKGTATISEIIRPNKFVKWHRSFRKYGM